MSGKIKLFLTKKRKNSIKNKVANWLTFYPVIALTFCITSFAEETSMTKNDINLAASKTEHSSHTQEWWNNNTSVITQIGNNNQARVEQLRNESFVYGNHSNIYQNGNRNEANIIQSGGSNVGLIGQIGNDHQATIEQAGSRFEAHVSQHGNQSNINISQSGSGLRSISVGQHALSGAAAPISIRTN